MGEIDLNGLKGDVEDITRLFKDNDLDLGRFIKSPKKINVPNWMMYLFPSLFIASLIAAVFIGNSNSKALILISLFSILVGSINTAIVYAKWEKPWLVWISIIAHVILIAIAFDVMSLEEVINKANNGVDVILENTTKQ